MSTRTPPRIVQAPARLVGRTVSWTGNAVQMPAVVRGGRLTMRQIKHAVETALRGQTFEADA